VTTTYYHGLAVSSRRNSLCCSQCKFHTFLPDIKPSFHAISSFVRLSSPRSLVDHHIHSAMVRLLWPSRTEVITCLNIQTSPLITRSWTNRLGHNGYYLLTQLLPIIFPGLFWNCAIKSHRPIINLISHKVAMVPHRITISQEASKFSPADISASLSFTTMIVGSRDLQQRGVTLCARSQNLKIVFLLCLYIEFYIFLCLKLPSSYTQATSISVQRIHDFYIDVKHNLR